MAKAMLHVKGTVDNAPATLTQALQVPQGTVDNAPATLTQALQVPQSIRRSESPGLSIQCTSISHAFD